MHVGFSQMERERVQNKSLSREQRFSLAFPGHKYKRTTYDDNRKRWFVIPEPKRLELVAAGRTPQGLWTVVGKLARGVNKSPIIKNELDI